MKNKITYISLIIIIIILILFLKFNNTGSNNENIDFNNLYSSNVYIESIVGEELSIGSGFVYKIDNDKAYIITCYHVITNNEEIYVYNNNKEFEKAQILNYDKASDIAILYINNTLNLKESKIGNSDNIKLGDNIYTLGTPLNDMYSYTLTHGIISYLNRKIKVNSNDYNTIQFDASITMGNSGGLLLNDKGEAVGMIFLMEANSSGISFAIPINDVMKEVKKFF